MEVNVLYPQIYPLWCVGELSQSYSGHPHQTVVEGLAVQRGSWDGCAGHTL